MPKTTVVRHHIGFANGQFTLTRSVDQAALDEGLAILIGGEVGPPLAVVFDEEVLRERNKAAILGYFLKGRK